MVRLTEPISADNVLLSYLSNLDVTEIYFLPTHAAQSYSFFVNELSNIHDIGIYFECTHADRK